MLFGNNDEKRGMNKINHIEYYVYENDDFLSEPL